MIAVTSTKSKPARIARIIALASVSLVVSACSTVNGGLDSQRVAPGEVPITIGTPVRDNRSPMEAALACFGDQMTASGRPVTIAVGEVRDYTGKYSINEGNAITQGGALMVYSALGKIGGSVRIAERFDPTIAERELGYTDRRQLGDGVVREVDGKRVPWLPYFGGTIARSDYFIIGGITEVNYNIRSGGAQVMVNNIGPEARVYTQSVAIDLRIVDTRSLIVRDTISLTKQFSGYEVGANVFRFFGTDLFDINIGAKGQEPLQLGIRTALEEGVLRLVASVQDLDPSLCMGQRLNTIPEMSADQLRGRSIVEGVEATTAAPPAPVSPPAAAVASPLNEANGAGAAGSGSELQIGFEFGDANLMANAQAVLDQIAQMAPGTSVSVMLIARDTENWDPARRDALLDQRMATLMAALANRGISPSAVTVTWRPAASDSTIHRDGPGFQEIARIHVKK
jgi:curli biogenesis system outer membrane secretion channel CsgG/outer membrane protein OmpA-like peptidoglycan-associated protein